MKQIIFTLILMICSLGATAQSAGDKILGTYKAVQEGKVSKVKFTKNGNGYRAQVIWLAEPKNPDGTPKLDLKNPDKAKQKVHSDRIVIIDKVTYDGKGEWNDGKIYDPTSGRTYTVEISFKDAKTLKVRGKLGPFGKNVYWTKLD